MPFKTALEAAIAHLVSKGRIKGSSDVAKGLGLKSRGTVSNYATGKTKLSSGFQTKFENKYGIRLCDFENLVGEGAEMVGELPELKKVSSPYRDTKNPVEEQDWKEKYFELLQKHTKQQDWIEEKVTVLQSRLNELLQNQLYHEAMSRAYQEYVVEVFWNLQGKSVDSADILKEIRRRAVGMLVTFQKEGIRIGADI